MHMYNTLHIAFYACGARAAALLRIGFVESAALNHETIAGVGFGE